MPARSHRRIRALPAALTVPAACLVLLTTPAHAKVCKDEISAHSRSAAQYSDAERERRARGGAIEKWRQRTRSTYGIAYRFWSRAEAKSVDCKTTKSAVACVAKARPCRLL